MAFLFGLERKQFKRGQCRHSLINFAGIDVQLEDHVVIKQRTNATLQVDFYWNQLGKALAPERRLAFQLALGDRGRRVSSVPNNNCSGQLCGKWFSYQPVFGCPFLSNKAWHSGPVSLENLSSVTDMPSTSRKQALLAKAEEILLQILLLTWIGATHTGRTSLSLSETLYVNRQVSNFSFLVFLGEKSPVYILSFVWYFSLWSYGRHWCILLFMLISLSFA